MRGIRRCPGRASSAVDRRPLEIDLLDGLGALVDNSLLRSQEGPGGEPRFRMLETIREFGVEQLAASNEGTALARRHAIYFLALAEEAEPHLHGPEQVVWLERLDSELDNLRGALTWATEGGREDDDASVHGVRLAAAVRRYWYLRNQWSEGRVWLMTAVAQGRRLSATRGRGPALGKVLDYAGLFTGWVGDSGPAEQLHQECLALGRADGDQQLEALALVR